MRRPGDGPPGKAGGGAISNGISRRKEVQCNVAARTSPTSPRWRGTFALASVPTYDRLGAVTRPPMGFCEEVGRRWQTIFIARTRTNLWVVYGVFREIENPRDIP